MKSLIRDTETNTNLFLAFIAVIDEAANPVALLKKGSTHGISHVL